MKDCIRREQAKRFFAKTQVCAIILLRVNAMQVAILCLYDIFL